MTSSTPIGSGRPKFQLPPEGFIGATKSLPLITGPLSELDKWLFLARGIRPEDQSQSMKQGRKAS